jgi:type II secretory pathway component GspD/PulD (secretin)
MLRPYLLALTLLFSVAASAEESVLAIIPINYRPAEEIQPLIVPLLDPSDRVAADGANLIVRTAPQRLEQIKALIAQLDSKPHNLLITVLQGQNLSAEQLNTNASVYLNVPLNKPSSTSGEIQGELNAYQERRITDNTQTIRTLEGQPAFIKVGKAQPVQSWAVYGYGYPAVVSSTTMLEATTGFAVTPRLSGDEVLIAVSPWSNQLQNNGVIDTQSATTNVRAKLGEWVEIGGVQEESQHSGQGFLSANSGSRSTALHILVKVEDLE